MLLGQGAEFSAGGEGAHLGSGVHCRREGSQRLLGVAAVAAGDDDRGGADPGGNPVFLSTGDRDARRIRQQPGHEPSPDARSAHAEDEDAVVARDVRRKGLGGHGGCRGGELFGEGSDEVAHAVGNPHEFTAGPTAGEA